MHTHTYMHTHVCDGLSGWQCGLCGPPSLCQRGGAYSVQGSRRWGWQVRVTLLFLRETPLLRVLPQVSPPKALSLRTLSALHSSDRRRAGLPGCSGCGGLQPASSWSGPFSGSPPYPQQEGLRSPQLRMPGQCMGPPHRKEKGAVYMYDTYMYCCVPQMSFPCTYMCNEDYIYS